MANTFRKIYKKTGSSGTSSDYTLVGNVGVGGVELDIMKGASSSADGEIGLVTKPISGQQNYLLSGSGTWINPSSFLGSDNISSIGDGTIKGAIKKLSEDNDIKPYYRANTVSGNQSDTIAVSYGTLIAIGRDAANQSGLYMVDNFGAVVTIYESGNFVTVTFGSNRLTIKNNLSVVISYMIISPLSL